MIFRSLGMFQAPIANSAPIDSLYTRSTGTIVSSYCYAEIYWYYHALI